MGDQHEKVDYGALIVGLILVAFVLLGAHYVIEIYYTGHW
jgi:hypothetical protein